jgi:hypothetical protein
MQGWIFSVNLDPESLIPRAELSISRRGHIVVYRKHSSSLTDHQGSQLHLKQSCSQASNTHHTSWLLRFLSPTRLLLALHFSAKSKYLSNCSKSLVVATCTLFFHDTWPSHDRAPTRLREAASLPPSLRTRSTSPRDRSNPVLSPQQ